MQMGIIHMKGIWEHENLMPGDFKLVLQQERTK